MDLHHLAERGGTTRYVYWPSQFNVMLGHDVPTSLVEKYMGFQHTQCLPKSSKHADALPAT